MSDVTISPNMGLPVPNVSIAPSPEWANDLNASLSILDGHSHVPGSGVQITPAAMNINTDLSFNSNNATLMRSVRFASQPSPISGASDLDCIYVSGVDLYYNDGNSNIVRITQSGGVAGSPGSISNLTSPASASYVAASSTFVWQSAANTAANMDFGAAIFRNITSGSNGITVQAPASLGSNYTITWPSLPSVTSVLTITNAGAMGTQTYDQVGQNMTSVGADAIAASMTSTGTNAIIATMGSAGADTIANNRTRLINDVGTGSASVGNIALSASCGNYTTNAYGPPTPVPNLSVTITTSGKPVCIGFIGQSAFTSYIQSNVGTALAFFAEITNTTNSTVWSSSFANTLYQTSSGADYRVPLVFPMIDTTVAGTPGTYNYVFSIAQLTGPADNFQVNFYQMIAYEL